MIAFPGRMRGRRKTDAGVERSEKKFVKKIRDIPAGHTIILVSTGLDGISNNPKSWVELKFAYPHVKILVAIEERRQGPAIAQGPDWYTTTHRRFLIFPLYQLILVINGTPTDCNAAISFAACMNESSIKRGGLAALGTRGGSGDRTQQYERALLSYLRCPRKDCGITLINSCQGSFSFEIHTRDIHGHYHRGTAKVRKGKGVAYPAVDCNISYKNQAEYEIYIEFFHQKLRLRNLNCITKLDERLKEYWDRNGHSLSINESNNLLSSSQAISIDIDQNKIYIAYGNKEVKGVIKYDKYGYDINQEGFNISFLSFISATPTNQVRQGYLDLDSLKDNKIKDILQEIESSLFDVLVSLDRRSEVSDEPVVSIDTSCSSPSNVSLGPNTHQDALDDELPLMDLDQNNSCPQLLVAQSKQEITHKSLLLKAQSVVSEKKKSRKEIDLTDETSNESKSKRKLEAEIGKYSDRTINDDALFLTLLNNKWERLRLTDQVEVFLFKAMKAKTKSVIRDVDAETPSFQDSGLPLEHILKLITISKISTCAKKDKFDA
ncbi:hypothetical protein BOTNAR_2320g00010 [Botryotinia narcissicola]|uniref:Uncharacterized protein n=1 Tax=Botryotinia narcissicola TaxID=278944 RepID=A0A4Z1H7X7_9HELO|nr:hypothetical protein BOTNAR_2320g00010 [Botryotinia narcissicola]